MRLTIKSGRYLAHDLAAALNEAEKADVNLPLGGIPIALKDLMNVEGQPCTCGSKILGGYRAPYTATAIEKLRAHGAIPFGRTNMDEFAMGSSTENSSVQLTRNPWDLSRVPGGSSGGSAAAVAADIAFGALGTDTGGSIRQPAALSGVVGFKPSYGRVSRFGLVAFASSLDQIGPLTKTVHDSALLMNAIAGHDLRDSTSLDAPVPDYTKNLGRDLKGIRIGLPKEYMIEGRRSGGENRGHGFGKAIASTRRGNCRGLAPAHRLRRQRLLHSGNCRSVSQPCSLRWRPLRPSGRQHCQFV
jgi:aspartyl-tRNA(Asn)/glutamyl-tRNA(Gln) amidotransferase subunit A